MQKLVERPVIKVWTWGQNRVEIHSAEGVAFFFVICRFSEKTTTECQNNCFRTAGSGVWWIFFGDGYICIYIYIHIMYYTCVYLPGTPNNH